MKKLLLVVLLLIPALSSAQTGRLINRVDRQVGSSVKFTLTPQGNAKTFNIAMHQMALIFPAGTVGTIHGDITNLTTSPVKIIFNRTHLRLPTDWTSSVCFGANCFASITDSIPPSQAFRLDPGVTGDFVLNIFDPDDYIADDSVIDYIRFTAVESDPGDTVSFVLKGIITAPAAVEGNQPKQSVSNPKIVMIYPTPLVEGSSIKVKVTSPRESNLSYSIYDGIGRVVALGVTRQRVGLGENTITIGSLDGLGNGSYMLKFNFSDGSSDTHFFQVMK